MKGDAMSIKYSIAKGFEIEAFIHTDGVIFGKIQGIPYCYTQAESEEELIENLIQAATVSIRCMDKVLKSKGHKIIKYVY